MKASDSLLAGRYGKALFEAADKAGTDAKIEGELAAAVKAAAEPALAAALKSPRLTAAEKKAKFAAALGAQGEGLMGRFLGLLIDKKRLELLPLVGGAYQTLAHEKRRQGRARVRTARPLSPAQAEALKKGLEKFSGRQVELDVREDPELIGGAVVRLGDWVIDGSLKGQLERLRSSLAAERN